jgi:hypothetical protein
MVTSNVDGCDCYAFLDVAFNSFGALAKLLIDQGIKL